MKRILDGMRALNTIHVEDNASTCFTLSAGLEASAEQIFNTIKVGYSHEMRILKALANRYRQLCVDLEIKVYTPCLRHHYHVVSALARKAISPDDY